MGVYGGASSSVWRKINGTIDASVTKTVFQFGAMTNFRGAVIHIFFKESTGNDVKSLQIPVGLVSGVPTYSVHGKIGAVDVSVDVALSGSNIEFSATNNELVTISYTAFIAKA